MDVGGEDFLANLGNDPALAVVEKEGKLTDTQGERPGLSKSSAGFHNAK